MTKPTYYVPESVVEQMQKAFGKVTSLSQHEEQDGDKGSCMSIQLVAMDMEKAEESMSEKADKIWPTS